MNGAVAKISATTLPRVKRCNVPSRVAWCHFLLWKQCGAVHCRRNEKQQAGCGYPWYCSRGSFPQWYLICWSCTYRKSWMQHIMKLSADDARWSGSLYWTVTKTCLLGNIQTLCMQVQQFGGKSCKPVNRMNMINCSFCLFFTKWILLKRINMQA